MPEESKKFFAATKFKLKTVFNTKFYPDPDYKREYKQIDLFQFIEPAVLKVNLIESLTYKFLNLFLRKHKYLFDITEKNLILVGTLLYLNGEKYIPKETKKLSDEGLEIIEFYNEFFRMDYSWEIPKSPSVSGCLNYSRIRIITCIENNIKAHYPKYVAKLIKTKFPDENKPTRKKIVNALWYNEEPDVDPVIINWINKYRDSIIPDYTYYCPKKPKNKVLNYFLKESPENFISHAYFINKKIEALGGKPYQVIPQKNDNIPGYVDFDYKAFIEVFSSYLKDLINIRRELNLEPLDTVKSLGVNAKKYKEEVFSIIFSTKVKRGILKINHLSTDGVGCSVVYTNYYENRKDKEETRINRERYERKCDKRGSPKNHKSEDQDGMGECYKKLKDIHIPNYKNRNIVGCDPGRNSVVTIVGNPKNINDRERFDVLEYTNKQRYHETGTNKAKRILESEKLENGINELEFELSNTKKRTLDYDKYLEYLWVLKDTKEKTDQFYQRKFHRNNRFRTFVKTQRSENEIIKKIKKDFNNPVIAMGDWSSSFGIKGIRATPNKRFTRLLDKNFDIILCDEDLTSKMNYDYRIPQKNAVYQVNKKIRNKITGKMERTKELINKECHKVLYAEFLDADSDESSIGTNSTEEQVNRCYVDRDINAAKNIRKILVSHLAGKKRPKYLCRNYCIE